MPGKVLSDLRWSIVARLSQWFRGAKPPAPSFCDSHILTPWLDAAITDSNGVLYELRGGSWWRATTENNGFHGYVYLGEDLDVRT